MKDELSAWTTEPNRHRGSSHLLSPATPPYMRVRIRRFSSIKLANLQQAWKSERVEVSNGKSGLQRWAVRESPRTMGTTGGLCRKVASDVPWAQSREPHRPPLPDHGSHPASH